MPISGIKHAMFDSTFDPIGIENEKSLCNREHIKMTTIAHEIPIAVAFCAELQTAEHATL